MSEDAVKQVSRFPNLTYEENVSPCWFNAGNIVNCHVSNCFVLCDVWVLLGFCFLDVGTRAATLGWKAESGMGRVAS